MRRMWIPAKGRTSSSAGKVAQPPCQHAFGHRAVGVTSARSQTKPVGIALDDQAIYWANQGGAPNTGEIMKLAR